MPTKCDLGSVVVVGSSAEATEIVTLARGFANPGLDIRRKRLHCRDARQFFRIS
jgi:hypothetical protein